MRHSHPLTLIQLCRYIVVDLMNGGDLRFHISRKTFTEEAVRFWIAELGCALRYIHRQRIVHRDIKPDNVLLDAEGHVHLGDFNVATNIVPGKPSTSKSGTLAYLAPEVYSGRGYYSECDWWSLGVLFYECIYNKRPFVANHHDELAHQILKREPPFPNTSPPVSNPCLHAISSLLEKNKRLRIGAAGWETFTDNPFFREIDFEALERKEIEPVFIPSSEKTNFDATYDLEELLLEEAPLEARARKQKPRPELRPDATPQEIQTDKWHRYIETYFTPFNYTALPPERTPADVSTTLPGTTSGRQTPLQRSPKEKNSAPALAEDILGSRPVTSRQNTDSSITGRASEDLLNEKRRTKKTKLFSVTGSQNNTGSTSGGRTTSSTHSSTCSPNGSPPLIPSSLADVMVTSHPQQQQNQFSGDLAFNPTFDQHPNLKLNHSRTLHYEIAKSNGTTDPLQRPQRPRAPTRSASMGGGIVLDNTVPGSSTADQGSRRGDKPSGMLGFLNRKKGRDRSPKAKDRERGVLGKEGARVILKD